jgi:hypothetical protein
MTITETNHHRASKDDDQATDPAPPFSGTTLEQVLQFVLPGDVARVSMVCKTWRDDLLLFKNPPSTETSSAGHDASGVVVLNNFHLTNGPAIVIEAQNPFAPTPTMEMFALWEDAKTVFHSRSETSGDEVLSKFIASVTLV